MINEELVKCFINQLSAEQLKKILIEFVNHYRLNDEYNLETVINGIVNIATKHQSQKIVDRADYLLVLKENTDLFVNKETKVIPDSIKIIGYDNIFNSVRIEYIVEGSTYPYPVNIDIDRIKEREKLNNLK